MCRLRDSLGVRHGIAGDADGWVGSRRGGPMTVIVPPAVSFAGPLQQLQRYALTLYEAVTRGTGWIDTNRPSQIIAFGAYFHGVK